MKLIQHKFTKPKENKQKYTKYMDTYIQICSFQMMI